MATMNDSLRAGGKVRGSLQVTARAATNIPVDITTHASQSVSAFRIRNSAGTTLLSLDNDGNLTVLGTTTTADTTVTDDFTVTDTLTVSGTATFNGNVVIGDASSDTLTVNSTSSFASTSTFTGNLNFTNASGANLTTNVLNVTGATTLGTTLFGAGTAAAPSISFTSDPDTGLYSAAANQLGFAVAGAVELTLNATNLSPGANDGLALGVSGTAFADLFLASGAVIDFAAGNAVVTHSSGVLTVSTGDLRVTTAGTNTASVVTVGGTQTLTGKTYDTAGAGNSFAINGTGITAVSGTGAVVLVTSATLVTPTLGVATATSINKVTITAPTTSATLTLIDGSSLVTAGANSITLTSTGATNVTLPTTGTLATLAGTEELDNKTLDSSVGKGTWTASGTWTLPAVTLGDTVTVGGGASATELRFLEPSGSGTNYTAFKAVAQSANITYSLPPTVGAAGTFLKDAAGDGVLTWAATTATTDTSVLVSTDFGSSTRFTETNAGGGGTTYGVTGASLATSATGTSSTTNTFRLSADGAIDAFAGNPTFSCSFVIDNVPASNGPTAFMGIGEVTVDGSGHTFTVNHIGFKLVMESGSLNLYATNANGTTETATSLLTGLIANDHVEVICVNTTGTSIAYYTRKNGAAQSSATTHSTNMPAGTADEHLLQFSASNNAVAAALSVSFMNAVYKR